MNRLWSILFAVVPLGAFVTLTMVCLQLVPLSTMGLPPAINTSGQSIDFLFRLVHGLCAGVLVITGVIIAWSLWRSGTVAANSRRAVYIKSNWLLEVTWTAIPGALLLWLAFYQLEVWSDTRLDRPTQTVGQQTIDVPPLVLVKARQYGWEFHYAGADQKIRTEDDVYCENLLVVPADRDVVLQLESRDVIHSFFVPELRLKQDIVPGMNHLVWFNAKATDRLEVLCAELCGEGHYRMRARMKVVEQATFESWLAAKSREDQPSEFLTQPVSSSNVGSPSAQAMNDFSGATRKPVHFAANAAAARSLGLQSEESDNYSHEVPNGTTAKSGRIAVVPFGTSDRLRFPSPR